MEDIIRSNNKWVGEQTLNVNTDQELCFSPTNGRPRRRSSDNETQEEGFFQEFTSSHPRRNATVSDPNNLLSPRRYKQHNVESQGDGFPRELRPDNVRSCPKPARTARLSGDSSDTNKTSTEDFDRESRSEKVKDSSSRSHRRSRSYSGRTDKESCGTTSRQGSGRSSGGNSSGRNSKVSQANSKRSGLSDSSGRSSKDSGSGRKTSSSRPSSKNGLPTSDETIYLQTFYKVMTSFNDKQKNCLALKDVCGSQGEPMFRRVVFQIIEKLNNDSPRNSTTTQQDLVLQSLSLICSDTSSASELALKGAVDDVLKFLLATFKLMISSKRSISEGANLKTIIHLVGAIALKSKHFRVKLEKREMFRTIIDKIVSNSSSTEQLAGENVVGAIVDISRKSQLMFELLLAIKTELTSISEHLGDLNELHDTPAISRHLLRVQDTSSILLQCRSTINSWVHQVCFTTEHKIQFQQSQLIPHLTSSCLLDDLSNCSHLLKMFITFSEQPILRELLLHEYSTEFLTLFMATMRCEEVTVQERLMKFWLAQRICENIQFRNFLFRSEGAMLAIMATMRAVRQGGGDALSMLSPFYEDALFLDMSLTNAQLIEHFGVYFQSGETESMRQLAGEVLYVFTEGLEKSILSADISNSFINSGILFNIMNMLSGHSGCDCGEIEREKERERGTVLLCVLVEDEAIREVFLNEPLGVLHCLVNSLDSFQDRGRVFLSLVAVLEVVACDPLSHPRLFESDIIVDLGDHIEDILANGSVSEATKEDQLLNSLNIFDIIASSIESCILFKQMKLKAFLTLLLQHESAEVRDVVSSVLNKLANSSSPTKWKRLIQKATKLF